MIITIIATIIPNEDPEDPDWVGALPEETLVELFELLFETPVVFVVFVVLTAIEFEVAVVFDVLVVFVVFDVFTAVVFVEVALALVVFVVVVLDVFVVFIVVELTTAVWFVVFAIGFIITNENPLLIGVDDAITAIGVIRNINIAIIPYSALFTILFTLFSLSKVMS